MPHLKIKPGLAKLQIFLAFPFGASWLEPS